MTLAAAFGTWVSPVDAELVSGQTVGLSGLSADEASLYWLELRPAERGRTVLVRRDADGLLSALTPPPFDVGSRVHEYGGGAYTVDHRLVVFSNKTDGFVWIIEGNAAPRLVVAAPGCRFADFRILRRDGRAWAFCVREDHRDRPAADPHASLVAIDLSGQVSPEANDGTILIQGPDFLAAPRPSPDGTRLAWIEWNHPDMPWDATRLCSAALTLSFGGVACDAPGKILLGSERQSVLQPVWSSHGVLHASSDRSGWWNLYRFGEDDQAEPICPLEAEIGVPPWAFGQRSFLPLDNGDIVAAVTRDGSSRPMRISDGKAVPLLLAGRADRRVQDCPVPLPEGGWAWLRAERDAPSAILFATPDTSAVDRPGDAAVVLRASSDTRLDPLDVSLAEPVSCPTGDGFMAHAFFYPPANGRFRGLEGDKPPLILVSHGGPTGMSSDAFSIRVQWWTTRGFAVADVNYGGSTGFGRTYRERLNGRWGETDVSDCVAIARHLAATGRCDPKRMAIRGGSAGGFTTLAALTKSDVFHAGASHYGVADLRLLAADTHKFESRYLDRLIGPLPEASTTYDERSPIRHVDRLSCPVIFFQGLDDKVVPPNQASTMVEAMRRRGIPVAHYEFAGEAHGFRQATTIRRVLELELDFFGQVFGFDPAGQHERAVIEA